MKFQALTEQEIQESMLLPEGEYEGHVFEAYDQDSYGNPLLTKNGVEKIDLQVQVYDSNGKPKILKCVLTESYIKILKHFCDATGLQDKYQAQSLTAADCKKTPSFIVIVSINDYENKKKEIVKINNISDFKPKVSLVNAKKEEVFFNDDVPF